MFEHDSHDGPECRRQRGEAGFNLAEMLVVLALIGSVIAIGIPVVGEQLRIAEVRSVADEMAVHLRAARMIAVSHHKDIVVTIGVDPTNTLSYEGTNGETRTITMPGRVKIKSGSAASITFHSDGSSGASSTVTTESLVSSATERWTLTVNTVGLVSVAHVRV
jgi:prepilin-type N-terminal cleavage/methylation domain-containing protein